MNFLLKYANKDVLGLGILWLFTVSAIIGISLGFGDWFLSKTPLNMLIVLGALVYLYPVRSPKMIVFTVFVYVVSLLIEMHGVHYGLIFGNYHYLDYLGPTVAGVPWLIGVNWTILVLATAGVVEKYISSVFVQILAGAILMTLTDAIIEPLAPSFRFWIFDGGMPGVMNYIGWFFCSLFFHSICRWLQLKGRFVPSAHVLASQWVFFVYFNLYSWYTIM